MNAHPTPEAEAHSGNEPSPSSAGSASTTSSATSSASIPDLDSCRPDDSGASPQSAASPTNKTQPHAKYKHDQHWRRPTRPFELENIPKVLCDLDHFVGWNYRWVTRRGVSQWDKPPVRIADAAVCDVTDPANWSSFATAFEAVQAGKIFGIGWAASEGTNVVVGDLDGCVDSTTRAVQAWALEVIERLGTYCEYSPSLTGIRFILLGQKPYNRCRRDNTAPAELYDQGRYVTLTGWKVPGCSGEPVANPEGLKWFMEEHILPVSSRTASSVPPASEKGEAAARRPHARRYAKAIDNFMAAVEKLSLPFEDNGKGGFRVRCPGPQHRHSDRKPSLEVDGGADCILLKCWVGCTTVEILERLGLDWSDLFDREPLPDDLPPFVAAKARQSREKKIHATADKAIDAIRHGLSKDGMCVTQERSWSYPTPTAELARVVRFDGTKDGQLRKEYRPISKVASGWVAGDPAGLWPLYRFGEWPDTTLYICEGEKCVDRMIVAGLGATTSAHGASSPHKTDWAPVAGRNIVILPDHDAAGEKYALTVAALIKRADPACRIRVLRLPGLVEKQDIYDWLEAGHTAVELQDLVDKQAEAMDVDAADLEPAGGQKHVEVPVQLNNGRPITLAKHFLQHGTSGRLVFWRGSFYIFAGSCYREVFEPEMKKLIYQHLDRLYVPNKSNLASPGAVKRLVACKSIYHEVCEALLSVDGVLLPGNLDEPAWLDGHKGPDPREMVIFANGCLHVPNDQWIDPTDNLFSLNALDYPYAPQAGEPRQWLKFLKQLWPDDQQSISTLQEFLGLSSVPDTRYQKCLVIIGPSCVGKGTLARTWTETLGTHNVVGTQFSSLGDRFGLQIWLGRRLAILADAHRAGRADGGLILERMLQIVGEDNITLDIKNKTPWTGKLPTRLMLLSTDMPDVQDDSGGLMRRYLILKTTSEVQKDINLNLTDELLAEKSAIMNWALKGYQRLNKTGKFTQPASADDLVQEMSEQSMPIKAFVDQACVQDRGGFCPCGDLFNAYTIWCREKNQAAGSFKKFGSNLRSYLHGLTKKQKVLVPKNPPVWCYEDIMVNPDYGMKIARKQQLDEARDYSTIHRATGDGYNPWSTTSD